MIHKSLTTKFAMTVAMSMAALSIFAQGKIEWVTWEEAMELSKTEPRKIVVDVYTDWCGWCKKMDKATFQQEEIADYVNENYYAIKFNAEMREDIVMNDHVYKFIKKGKNGYHELAAKITYGRLSYPTIVFLDEEMEVIQPIPGFKDPDKFSMIMTYFAEDHHKTTPWKTFCTKYETAQPTKD